MTGTLDQLTLSALGVADSSQVAVPGTAALVMLTDAINDLVQTTASGKSVILAATNNGLYRSFDPAKGWEKLPYGASFDVHTSALSTSALQPDTILVGTALSGVLISNDGGSSWRQIEGVPTETPINVIAQDPERAENIYVGTKQAFYASHDGGRKWTRRGGNLPYGDFTSILINPQNSNEIFAGNAYQNGEFGGGVYRSSDGGSTWVRIDPKDRTLPSLRIWALALDPQHQNTLFVGSHSAGIYVVPRSAARASVAPHQ